MVYLQVLLLIIYSKIQCRFFYDYVVFLPEKIFHQIIGPLRLNIQNSNLRGNNLQWVCKKKFLVLIKLSNHLCTR